MISEENKLFLKEKFNIDCETISKEDLNKYLDKVILITEDEIKNKQNSIDNLKSKLYNEISKID